MSLLSIYSGSACAWIISEINRDTMGELQVVIPKAASTLLYPMVRPLTVRLGSLLLRIYIEAFGKKLVIHTSSRLSGIKEDTISGYTLSGLLALLDDPAFVQCHKSYVVNKSHIEKIDKSERKIFLKGFTDTIPIGNKYQAELWG